MSDLIVSVSGIRGIVGKSLLPDAACRFAAALGTYLGGGRVVVSRDGRPSGEALQHAIFAGLMSTGCTAESIGIAPTPTVGVAVRTLSAAGGIQITASHNPAPWNGLKMFGPDGAVLPAEKGAQVRGIFESGEFSYAAWDGLGRVNVPPDVQEAHLHSVLEQVSLLNVAHQGFRVLIDGNGGAGGPLAVQLLHHLGCGTMQIGCDPNGVFAHEAEPTPAHLADVAPWVKQSGSAVGFALDPDADRLALIDEEGNCISEELTLALAVKYRLRQVTGPVVVNMSTSRVIEDLAKQQGCAFVRSAVGEAERGGADAGDERRHRRRGQRRGDRPPHRWVRDPFIGMALILSLMAEEKKPLSQLVGELPRYAMLKTKVLVTPAQLAAGLAKLPGHWPDAKVTTLDGLRLDGPDWWLHARASNTEPIVRVIAEAPTEERARELCEVAGGLLKG